MWTSQRIIRCLERIQHWTVFCFAISSVGFVIWNVSAFVYGGFHYLYMPSQTHQVPVDFTFTPCEPDVQNARGVSKCSFPTATVEMPRLTDDTKYSISVRFLLASPADAIDVRTFIACVEVLRSQGSLDEACKPLRLTSKSRYARFVDFALSYPVEVLTRVLLDGSPVAATDESETREVEFFKSFAPRTGDDRLVAKVIVKDVRVEVIAAVFNIHISNFRGLRFVLWRYPSLSKYVAVSTLSFSILLGSMYFWQWLVRPNTVAVASIPSRQEAARTRLKAKGTLRKRFPTCEDAAVADRPNTLVEDPRHQPDD